MAERAGAFLTAAGLGENGRIVRALGAERRREDRGGRLRLQQISFCECFGDAITPVLLFGAGHVGRAVVLALAPLPFTVRWIDSRPDQFPDYVPQNVVTVCTAEHVRELDQAPRDAMIVVMTHSHPLDFDITAAALRCGAFEFVGLIGSETKRARFVNWARQAGVASRQIDRLVCPIGIAGIKGKEPAMIAAGLAAQLLIVRERAPASLDSPATQPA